MKTLAIITALLLSITLVTQVEAGKISSSNSLSGICKVFGAIKYYHPQGDKGSLDWDSVLLNNIPHVLLTDDSIDYQLHQDILLSMVRSCKSTEPLCSKEIFLLNRRYIINDSLFMLTPFSLLKDTSKYFYFNSLKWLADTNSVPLSVQKYLISYILNYKNAPHIRYKKASYANTSLNVLDEKTYKQFNEKIPLLALFRVWNIIQYFYPYRYKLDNWYASLDTFIPKFINAKTVEEYNFAVLEFSKKIHDTHTVVKSKIIDNFFGTHYLPFKTVLLNDKLIITKILNDSLSNSASVKVGDVITQIGSHSIDSLILVYKNYISYSNASGLNSRLNDKLIRTANEKPLPIVIERKTKKTRLDIQPCLLSEKQHADKIKQLNNGIKWKDIDGTGYLNLVADYSKKEFKEILKRILQYESVIIDIRGYPKSSFRELPKSLLGNKKVKESIQKIIFHYYPSTLLTFTNYFRKKKAKSNVIKAVVLINQEAISYSEYLCVLLNATNKATFIGSNTTGAMGGVYIIPLPCDIFISITGHNAYYFPDGKEIQNNGITPDIQITPTIKGIKEGRDEVLERAIEYINTGE